MAGTRLLWAIGTVTMCDITVTESEGSCAGAFLAGITSTRLRFNRPTAIYRLKVFLWRYLHDRLLYYSMTMGRNPDQWGDAAPTAVPLVWKSVSW